MVWFIANRRALHPGQFHETRAIKKTASGSNIVKYQEVC